MSVRKRTLTKGLASALIGQLSNPEFVAHVITCSRSGQVRGGAARYESVLVAVGLRSRADEPFGAVGTTRG